MFLTIYSATLKDNKERKLNIPLGRQYCYSELYCKISCNQYSTWTGDIVIEIDLSVHENNYNCIFSIEEVHIYLNHIKDIFTEEKLSFIVEDIPDTVIRIQMSIKDFTIAGVKFVTTAMRYLWEGTFTETLKKSLESYLPGDFFLQLLINNSNSEEQLSHSLFPEALVRKGIKYVLYPKTIEQLRNILMNSSLEYLHGPFNSLFVIRNKF